MAALRRQAQERLYCQGWINIKTLDVEYRRHFAQLKGCTLYLYSNEANVSTNKVEKQINLEGANQVKKDNSVRARNQSAFATISISFPKTVIPPCGELRIRATKSSDQEEWYRVLLATVMHKLPDDTSNLLPGQVQSLRDIIVHANNFLEAKHGHIPMDCGPTVRPAVLPKPRRTSTPAGHSSPSPIASPDGVQQSRGFPVDIPSQGSKVPDHPTWYFPKKMGRAEAEEVLNNNSRHGNMLIRHRDADDQWKFAVSVKIRNEENPYKHYRVRKKYTASGQVEYEIFLGDKKHPKLLSMTEVIDYFVKESENNFVPLKKANVHPHHEYDHIVKEEWNTEIDYENPTGRNGEKYYNFNTNEGRRSAGILRHASQPGIPSRPPRTGGFPPVQK